MCWKSERIAQIDVERFNEIEYWLSQELAAYPASRTMYICIAFLILLPRSLRIVDKTLIWSSATGNADVLSWIAKIHAGIPLIYGILVPSRAAQFDEVRHFDIQKVHE